MPFKQKLVSVPGGGRNNFFCVLIYLLLFKQLRVATKAYATVKGEREREEGGKIRRDGKSLEDADLSDPRAMQNRMSCNGFTLV